MKLGYENWIRIPCAPRYEINGRGDVRNIKTGRLIKPWVPKDRVGDKQFALCLVTGGRPKNFHQSSLLWLTHGKIPKRKTHSRLVVPVIISRGGERHFFDSCRQAAQFLSGRDGQHAAGYIIQLLARRNEEIFGWRINYQR